MKAFSCLLALLFTMVASSLASVSGQSRILLIPLDDRPPCLQWPILMAPIGGAEIVAPPRELLGRFMDPGNPAGIAEWIRTQDLNTFDAIIVSVDMLAYGGLVASRTHQVGQNEALERLRLIKEIRAAHPGLEIYAFNIIMRLAPTADATNDAWRRELARWAEIAPLAASDPAATEEIARLEERIPGEVLTDYQRARTRNLAVNRATVGLVESGAIDYLILGQDDAKPQGVHVADRKTLLAEIEETGTGEKIAVQPGADEVAMLLLARILTNRAGVVPTIHVVYSSEAGRTNVAPFEDRPLHETVSLQIAAAGSREIEENEADLLYYVFASRHEPGIAEPFADQIAAEVKKGRHVIVADIDTRGNIQGGSVEFTEALLAHGVFPRLAAYASWNTAGNTLGTALPQGILHYLTTRKPLSADPDQPDATHRAQLDFLLHRLINDYAYHGVVRPDINRVYAREQGMNTMRLSPEETLHLQRTILARLHPLAAAIESRFRDHAPEWEFSELRFELPWGRTFEAEIDFSTSPATSNGSR